MRGFFWVLTIVAALLAGLVLVVGEVTATGAPQEAAVGAIAVAIAVIPYCLARAVSELVPPNAPRPVERVASNVRCNECNRVYSVREMACPSCGAHRMDAVPV